MAKVKREESATTPLFISARNKENIDELRELLYNKVRELHVQKYPYNDFLYQIDN
jgi:GTP-binding protein HflX